MIILVVVVSFCLFFRYDSKKSKNDEYSERLMLFLNQTKTKKLTSYELRKLFEGVTLPNNAETATNIDNKMNNNCIESDPKPESSVSSHTPSKSSSASSSPLPHDSVLEPRVFVHDPGGGGHWEEYVPGEDRPPELPDPPSIRRNLISPYSSAQYSSIQKDLRDTKRLLSLSRAQVSELRNDLSESKSKVYELNMTYRRMRKIFIFLTVFLCLFVAFIVSSIYKQSAKQSYAEGESVGYDSGYDDGYKDGSKSKLGSFADKNSTASTSSGNTGATRDTAIAYSYIGNKRTKKYHYPFCSYLPDNNNQIVFSSAEEAEAQGYDPCRRCNPG